MVDYKVERKKQWLKSIELMFGTKFKKVVVKLEYQQVEYLLGNKTKKEFIDFYVKLRNNLNIKQVVCYYLDKTKIVLLRLNRGNEIVGEVK